MENNDLISKKTLLEIIANMPTAEEGGIASSIYRIIQKQPTVDAAPVVHGRWLEKQPTCASAHKSRMSVCSKCGATGRKSWHYCHNCGAKLDGGNDNGKTD